MTTSSAAGKASAGTGARADGGAAGWLALAASPTFALMAVLSAADTMPMALCAPEPRLLPLDGMTAMYVLMGLFHLPPWLKLARRRPRAPA
jgi:hypothetical protein